MDYYTRNTIVSEKLQQWIENKKRENWSTFCRKISLALGVQESSLRKRLETHYPTLTIYEDKLELKENVQ